MSSTTANVLATIGTILWCVQMIPQIIHNYRHKDTEGLNQWMVLLWCLCAPFFAIYFVSENSTIPIQLQPHLFGFFCLIVYLQVLYYPPVSRPKKDIILRGGLFVFFWVALEVGFIIPLRKEYSEGVKWPLLVFGIIGSVLLAVGLLPPYYELSKRQGRVVGINFIFLATDLSGAVFSLASLAIGDIDVMGCILYSICACLEVGIFMSHAIWWLRFGRRRKPADGDLTQVCSEDEEDAIAGEKDLDAMKSPETLV
ncbi:hypothetical protein KL942_003294 [Ogataea angusta]|uniref:PQ-loop-domain-containing protein n=1 Tax=Pichia angusta TaxID=870730 RepID=A0AAN6DGI6_PICAN|nr:uncharacterized protein KL928_003677 [Ogataea angusta]KAG7817778.1 hypothetical protein KL928_003677 [Ogataea angusta]KAG7822730.1 hypothetical protein KL909_003895 [Ogataea angusta]KAG7827669.1 hypothetical protein KL920_004432 [Ogataea angusta]KAG7833616.1 hypothetical protein KL943_003724 [Ogataea angusta]KAG7839683.1 hypothetical protein KL942_003294 [Ogataea angusta]